MCFFLTGVGDNDFVLGYSFLYAFNLNMDWRVGQCIWRQYGSIKHKNGWKNAKSSHEGKQDPCKKARKSG